MGKQFLHMQKLAGLITESEYKKLTTLNESNLKNRIKELIQSSLDEAKKKKKKEKDVAPQEDTETTTTDTTSTETTPTDTETTTTSTDTTTTPTDTAPQADTTDEVDIDPKVKAIQDSLQKALANAKQLGDEKLVKQIGNTLTMLVRTQVLGATQQGPTEQ